MTPHNPISPKVTLPLFAGAVTTIIAYLVELFANTDIPTAVGTAITVVIMAGVGYLKRDPLRETPPV